MARLIDADALQNILLPITTALEHEYGSLGGAVSGCMKHIDNAPTVDAAPVVRCKDCKWFADNNNGDWFGCWLYNAIMANENDVPKADDFCSYGERREK